MTSDAASIKVFLADDSELICDRLQALFAVHRIEVVGRAGTPQECIAGVLATRADVVVLDIELQGGTGVEVMRSVHERQPGTAFVVFSLHADPAHRKLYLRNGAASYLDKALEYEKLVEAVKASCRRSAR